MVSFELSVFLLPVASIAFIGLISLLHSSLEAFEAPPPPGLVSHSQLLRPDNLQILLSLFHSFLILPQS